MARLKTVGWTAIGPESDVWHKIQLVRARQDESAPRVERAVVDTVGDGLAAFALDDYGNRQPLAERAVTVDRPPLDAHAELVAELESDGWQVEGDGAPWFATTLTRRALRSAP